MRIRIFFIPIILFSLGGLLSACDNEKTQEEEDFILDNVYYYDYNTYKYIPISTNDALYSKVGSTVSVMVETASELEIQSDKDRVEIKESVFHDGITGTITTRVFDIHLKQASSTTINIIDSSAEKFVSFTVVANTLAVKFSNISHVDVIGAETVYTINVAEESLKDKILEELKEKYVPKNGQLFYTSLTGGELGVVTGDRENLIEGTFTVETVEDGLKLFNIFYNEKACQLSSEQISGSTTWYPSGQNQLTQDLTEEFRVKYPSAAINKIEIVSVTLFSLSNQ